MKEAIAYSWTAMSPHHIKYKIAEMQQMTVPELFISFFKNIFYAFYYSGYGASLIIGYLLKMLMSLMRGPQIEEPVVVAKEEEEKTHMRMLPALPAAAEEPNKQMQAFGLDIMKEDNGEFKVAPHESPAGSQPSSVDEQGESTPEEGGESHPEASVSADAPLSLQDLLGWVFS